MSNSPAPAAPLIQPVPPGVRRPLISVMIPAFNYGHYLRETLRSILAQDPGPDGMQIMIVDDCSTADDPESVAREIGGARIEFFRQPRNLGLVGNMNDCISRSHGHWIHLLHEDDFVMPGFYERAAVAIRTHPEIGAWICRLVYIDQRGNWIGLSELDAEAPGMVDDEFVKKEFVTPRIQFAGIIVKRAVYEAIGGFRPELKLCFDWDMWRRVLLHAPAYYDPRPLAGFRLHPASAYAQAGLSGDSVEDERRAICLGDSYLAPELAKRIHAEAMIAAGIRAARMARHHAENGDWRAARAQIAQALRCSRAPEVIARCFYFAAAAALQTRRPPETLGFRIRPAANPGPQGPQ